MWNNYKKYIYYFTFLYLIKTTVLRQHIYDSARDIALFFSNNI